MRYVKFTIEEDDEYGIIGVVPNIFKNWPNYLPSSSFGLAHDLLEHGTRETGTVSQEFAALGGYLFVRGFGRFNGNMVRSVEDDVASGMGRSYQDSTEDGIQTPPVTYGMTTDELNELNEFLPDFRLALIKDWEDDINYEEDEEWKVSHPYTDENWEKIIGWIKYGFVRAKRRFDNNQWMAWTLKKSIEDIFNAKLMNHLETYQGTGIEFTLALDKENGKARLMDSPYL